MEKCGDMSQVKSGGKWLAGVNLRKCQKWCKIKNAETRCFRI